MYADVITHGTWCFNTTGHFAIIREEDVKSSFE